MHKIESTEDTWSAEISVSDSEKRDKVSGTTTIRDDIHGIGKVYKPENLATRISEIMDQLVKESSSDFSTETIIVRIESNFVIDLTIIDLPGIIRTTTAGQSQSVISQVDNLLNYFMKQQRTIILAVIPANQV
jgi:hypothetical protein